MPVLAAGLRAERGLPQAWMALAATMRGLRATAALVGAPMNCPECDAFMQTDKCRGCGWTRPAAKESAPDWKLPEHLRSVAPLTGEEAAKLKAELAALYQKFGVPVEKARRLETESKRCPTCESPETGKFNHNGVRYCVTCYGKL